MCLQLQFIWMIDDSVECFHEYHLTESPQVSRKRKRTFPRKAPAQGTAFLNLRVLQAKKIFYKPELQTFEEMLLRMREERDNRVMPQAHVWKHTGACSPSKCIPCSCFIPFHRNNYLPEDHPLYLDYRRTVRNITVSNLIRQLEGYRLCDGVSIMELNGKLYHHVIPLSHDTFGEEEEQQFPHKGFWRAKGCFLLCPQPVVCCECDEFMCCSENARKSKENQSAKMTKNKPKFGALPKLNKPKKSHESSKPSPRPERSVVKFNEGPLPHSCYKGFSELFQRVKSLKSLGDWSLKIFEDKIVLKKTVHPYVLPRLEIIMDDSLGFTVKVFGSYLPEDHPLYLDYRRTVRNITVSNLIRQLKFVMTNNFFLLILCSLTELLESAIE
ncbi:hypothetical protein pdam_00011883 [Pocillopora damicornis]|uniref:Uncharacterized protein n=1 Tax=Pocillopora damicornis TaxID=46731 RepID=A0A3M6V032_POCDA|nr:hypothetical protein pdam_00011883 [Pocillopora damicornis]